MTAGVVYPDGSYYQPPLDMTYSRGVISFRGFDGDWEDPYFRRNLLVAAALVKGNRATAVVIYLVFRPGKAAAQVAAFKAAVKAVLGAVPRWLCAELDCESWGGKIQGDRSAELNGEYALLCQYLGADARRVGGYANRPDFAALWPSRPPRMRTRLAHYGRLDFSFPNLIAQQYTDGQPKFDVAGLPSSTPPWGRCDHNIAPGLTPATFAVAMGAIITARTPEELKVAAQLVGIDQASADRIGQANATWLVRRRLEGANYPGNVANLLVDLVNTQHGVLAEAQKQTELLTAIANNTRPPGTSAR